MTYNYHAEVVGFDETFDDCWEDVHVKLYHNGWLVQDYGVVRVYESTQLDVDYQASLSIDTHTFDLHTKGTDGIWNVTTTTITVYRPPLTTEIAGPNELDSGSWGKWYAQAGGGYPPYTYYWEWKLLCELSKSGDESVGTMGVKCGSWNFGGTDDPYENTFYTEGDYQIRVTVTDSLSNTATDTDYFTIYPVGTLNPAINSPDTEPPGNSGNLSDMELRQNYPNPFNPVTAITFAIPKSQHVTVSVFDVAGRLVEILVNSSLGAGSHEVVWDASGYPSGAYIYRVETEDIVEARMMNLVK